MWCCEHHRLDRRVAERVLEMRALRDVDLAHEADVLAFRDRGAQRLPPAPEADEGGGDHSGWMPACRMSRDQRTVSLLMYSANCSGPSGAASTPQATRRALNSLFAIAAAMAACSLAIVSRGAPAGVTMPYQSTVS